MSDCIFCRIASGEVPTDQVFADDDVVAFPDTNPQAPTHILVVPREHLSDWSDLATNRPELAAPMFAAVAAVADQLGIESYRVVSNRGAEAGQAVDHLHLHVLGGRSLSWPPG